MIIPGRFSRSNGISHASTGEARSLKHLALALLFLGCAIAPVRVAAQTISIFASSAPISGPTAVATDSSGDIYIANSQGDGVNNSSVIRIAPGGTVSTVYTPGGTVQFSGLAVDSSGNLYIADSTNDNITKVTPAGSASVFYAWAAGATGLAIDSADNVYVGLVVTVDGGIQQYQGEILKITPTGSASVVPNSLGWGAGGALAVDSAGNLYAASGQSVSKFTPSGSVDQTFFTEPLPAYAQSLTTDSSGNLYAGYYYAPHYYDVPPSTPFPSFIEKITPAGTGSVVDSGNFIDPAGMAFAVGGNLLVADPSKNTLSSVTPGDAVAPLLGNGIAAPAAIAFDARQNLYVTGADSIVEISPAGVLSTFVDISAGLVAPVAIAFDASGNLFVLGQLGTISKVTPSGTVSTLVPAGSFPIPISLAIDASGNLYVSDHALDTISKITPNGAVSTFVAASAGIYFPGALTFDSAGNLYDADGAAPIVKITPAGKVSTFVAANQGLTTPSALSFDSSGNLYAASGNEIFSISPTGTVNAAVQNSGDQATPQLNVPTGLAFDASGSLYVAEPSTNEILKVAFQPSPLVAAILPGSRSVEVGTTATVFATMINTGSTDLDDCGVRLPFTVSALPSLGFQTTDPTTNAVTGTPNAPATIKAGASQSFLLAFQSSDPLDVFGLAPAFFCNNVTPATATIGVDTLDLVFSPTPIADIIALAATATGDGALHLVDGSGAFAVATIDAGAPGTLTLQPYTGSASLPVTITVCETDATGQCLTSPADSVSVDYTANATPTFSVFVAATAPIPFSPGTARILVRFVDSDGHSHGVTSVAITTD